MSVSEKIAFDSNGDLTMKVGWREREFLVCSKTVARASPVFKAMLYGNFKEARPADPTESWIVNLPEDGSDSMEILFNIIHSHFDNISHNLSLENLFGVLVVAEKYDMTQVIRPWIKDWVAPYLEDVKPDRYALMLCVTWELGLEAIFMNIAKSMCIECGVNSSGQLVIEYQSSRGSYSNVKKTIILELPGHLEPPGLLGEFLSSRSPFMSAGSSFELAGFHVP
jgi:BTB/POZ domain